MAGMEQWRGRVAMVTGASAGIGRALARALVADGMKVAALARRVERLDALQAELGEGLLPLPCDLRDEAAIRGAFAAVAARWGGVDVLINNAGLGHKQSLVDGETEAWREMLEVNVLALTVCTREALQQMLARGVDGHVLHLSSMASHRVPPGSGMYSATKYAVRALTEALRKELRERGSGIRVTAISPGLVETEFAQVFTGSTEQAAALYSSLRVLDPADVVEAVRYALSQPPHVQVHDVLLRPTQQVT